jgi:hypothetical protein
MELSRMDSTETANKFRVASHADDMVTLVPIPGYLTHADALRLAAWLVAIVDPEGTRFAELLTAVQASRA